MGILIADVGFCYCRWQVKYQNRTFEIEADFNGRPDLTNTRFERISGKSFWFNRHSIHQLKKELAKQIIPVCGAHCPLIQDELQGEKHESQTSS